MGALFGEQCMIETEDYNQMVGDSIDIGVYAEYSAEGKINSTFGSNHVETEVFHSFTRECKIYSKGAIPPSNLEEPEWEAMTKVNPMPMKLRLASIDTLPIQGLVSASVLSNIKLALSEYCPKLLADGKLSSCELPEDIPLPKPRTWTKWATKFHSHLDEEPVIECPEGQYVTQMQFKRTKRLMGWTVMNFRLKCSGKTFHNFHTFTTLVLFFQGPIKVIHTKYSKH